LFTFWLLSSVRNIGAGTIFWLREQTLNDFSAGGAKIGGKNQDNQIQSITLCSMYFSKKVYNGVWGKSPEAGDFSRIFVIKVTLQCVRLLLTVSYRKKIGERDVLLTLCLKKACDAIYLSIIQILIARL